MTRLALLFVLSGLLACGGDGPGAGLGRKPSDAPAGLHLLVTTMGGFSAETVLTGAIELDLDLEPTWRAAVDAPAGALGAVRLADGDTLVMATEAPPGTYAEVLRVGPDSAVVDRIATADGQSFAFPHGIGQTADGVIVVGDSFRGRVVGLDGDTGAQVWSLAVDLFSEGSISGAYLGPREDDGSHRLGLTLVGNIADDSTQHTVRMYRIPAGGGEPVAEWAWPSRPDIADCLWPHGVTFDADGTVLVGLGGLGQIVRLDAAGAAVRHFPPDDAPRRLNFPRHVAVLPDGRWVVSDGGTELLVVADPEGAFAVEDARALQGVYDVHVLDCAAVPCHGSADAPVGF